MKRILLAASDLQSSSTATLFSQLAPALPRDRFEVAVLDMGTEADPRLLPEFAAAKIPTWKAPLKHLADVRGLRRVLSAIREFGPSIIHVGGSKAAHLAGLMTLPMMTKTGSPKFVASGVDRPMKGLAVWWQRRIGSNITRFLAPTPAEAARYAKIGVPSERITVVPPAVKPANSTLDGAAFCASLNLPASARLLVASGRFDSVAGLKSAIWAFDVVKYVSPDLHLILIGDGPERERLTRLSQALGYDDYRVRFLGQRSDVPSLLTCADLVWITHERGGANFALEAMAAGKPIVAMQNSDLGEIITDKITGRFVDQNDRVQLAAVSNELLENASLLTTLGDAGRERAKATYSVGMMAERVAAVYDSIV
jgi:glycosyltransferase involved in cell wall biosynthesis